MAGMNPALSNIHRRCRESEKYAAFVLKYTNDIKLK